MSAPRGPQGHGYRACYLRGCRTAECVAAHARYCKEYSLRRLRGDVPVDVAETRRLMRALLRQMTWARVAEELKCSHSQISYVLKSRKKVTREFAGRVEAAAAFYLPRAACDPYAIDEVAVQWALSGQPVDLTLHERRAVVDRAGGRSAAEVADLINATRRTVVRYRGRVAS